MKGRKGLEMTFSTIIVVILAILLLVVLVYFIVGGFDRFKTSVKPFDDVAGSSGIKAACDVACKSGDKIGWCETKRTLEGFNNNVAFTCNEKQSDIGITCVIEC